MAMGKFKRAVLYAAFLATVKITAFVVGLHIFAAERQPVEGSIPKDSPAYTFLDDCFAATGTVEKSGPPGEKTFCMCTFTEVMRHDVAWDDLSVLLQRIEDDYRSTEHDGNAPRGITRLPLRLQDFYDSALPRCREKADKVVAMERRLEELR